MKKSTVRTIYEIKLEEENGEIRITYRGNGFLYNMVRILTGTLIEVGRGEKMAESIDGILEAKERSSAGLPYRQEVLLYQKFVIENKSEKERTEKRKTMSNTLQEQIEMEEEVRFDE